MRFEYCAHCGSKAALREIGDEGLIPYCEKCNAPLFDMFPCAIIVLVVNELGEAAVLRQGYISDTYANLVSGYMKSGETAEETARREVEEEIGITLTKLNITGTYWFGRKDMLMIGFIGKAQKKPFTLSKEVDSASWMPANEALRAVHPEGSVSYELLRLYLAGR